MNNFRVPPSPTWYVPPACSPENGLLYITGNHTSIAYIPSVKNDDSTKSKAIVDVFDTQNVPNIQIIQTHNQFKSIDCDPNWSSSKWFVTMNEQNMIWVWDLETGKVCRGHKAHVPNGNDRRSDLDNQIGGAMCISKNRQVLSIDRNAFVRYCLTSNTYSIFPENFVLKRGMVSILKISPYNQDIIGVGYKNGLIVIVNYAETTTLQTLRGHDSEIVSLQWTFIKAKPQNNIKMNENIVDTPGNAPNKKFNVNSTPSAPKSKFNQKKTEQKQKNREPPKPIVDAGDIFDIHSFDYLEEEFGTISTKVAHTTDDPADDEKPSSPGNENFNFAEECQTLREKIRAGNESDSSDESYKFNGIENQSAVNMSDIRKFMENKEPNKNDSIPSSDDSDEPAGVDELSNRSTIGSSHNTTEIVELEEVINDLNINDDCNGIIYLASGAQESNIVIWNIETGTISDKIQLKSEKGRSKIPKSNCTIAWISSNALVANGPDGRISTWKATDEASDKKLKFTLDRQDFSDTAVINICSNVEYKPIKPIVWTFSTHLNIVGHCFDGIESSEIISKYATLPIGMFTLRVCPHDPNKIAIAGNNKRINILDLSTLKYNNIEVHSLTSKVQGKVIALGWHPTNENLLSFSTIEGRIGVFNISKTATAPELMKNFNGRDLYGLSYGIDVDSKKCTLYVTNHQQLMLFNENSTKEDNHNALEFKVPVSSVSSNNKFIAIGFSNGTLKILLNDQQKTEVFSEMISKKYISEVSWSTVDPNKLAVSSNDNNIFIFKEDDKKFHKIGELTGHNGGVTFVSWSGQSEHKLVSASFDHTVRVWDTQKLECIAWFEYENKMNCATFLPTDENFVVCSGQSETMHMFEIGKRLVADIGTLDIKKKKKPFNTEVQWGTKYQNEASKLQSQEKKKLRQLEKKSLENVEKITDQLNGVQLSSASLKLNHTTILYLTNKEINKNPLDHLQNILQKSTNSNSTGECSNEFLHGKLFGDREDVMQLLNDELKNHQFSKTNSIGNLLIPQIQYDLKANIIESIEKKSLTEQHVSLAPSISYEFWKNCSLAYANQCFEQGFVLQAIPHLLAIQQVNEAIEKLGDTHFYREAWCIAKMYKESEDNIFEMIATKWIQHLEVLGNLEGAALISFLAGKRELSFDILNKRKFKTAQIEDILNLLSPVATNESN